MERVRVAEALLGIAGALARHVRQRTWYCSAGCACDLPEEGVLLFLFDFLMSERRGPPSEDERKPEQQRLDPPTRPRGSGWL